MNRQILDQYTDAKARIIYLRDKIAYLEDRIGQMNESGYYVSDVVSLGKKGKKSLGTVVIKGFPYPEYDKISAELEKRRMNLAKEQKQLEYLTGQAEEYIAGLTEIEIRNILSLHYIDNLTWVQVAHRMNELYSGKKKYFSSDSCRCKHERFFERAV